MVELSFYWSLFFSQFVDVQRKVGHKVEASGGEVAPDSPPDICRPFDEANLIQ